MEPYTITQAFESLIRMAGALILGTITSSNLIVIFIALITLFIMILAFLFVIVITAIATGKWIKNTIR